MICITYYWFNRLSIRTNTLWNGRWYRFNLKTWALFLHIYLYFTLPPALRWMFKNLDVLPRYKRQLLLTLSSERRSCDGQFMRLGHSDYQLLFPIDCSIGRRCRRLLNYTRQGWWWSTDGRCFSSHHLLGLTNNRGSCSRYREGCDSRFRLDTKFAIDTVILFIWLVENRKSFTKSVYGQQHNLRGGFSCTLRLPKVPVSSAGNKNLW